MWIFEVIGTMIAVFMLLVVVFFLLVTGLFLIPLFFAIPISLLFAL
jgi:hypothetical protein